MAADDAFDADLCAELDRHADELRAIGERHRGNRAAIVRLSFARRLGALEATGVDAIAFITDLRADLATASAKRAGEG